MILFFFVMMLYLSVSVLHTFWVRNVVKFKPINSALIAGACRTLLVIGMWCVFVNKSYEGAAGMIIGEAVGAYIGVSLSKKFQNKIDPTIED